MKLDSSSNYGKTCASQTTQKFKLLPQMLLQEHDVTSMIKKDTHYEDEPNEAMVERPSFQTK